MVDYVKVRPKQPGLAALLRSDKRLIWTDQLDGNRQKTGVKTKYHGLTWFVANSGFIEITGSLHKCWNITNGRGDVNWNDFNRLDLYDILYWLTQEFGVDLTTATVHNIEFGVNLVQPPAPPTVRDLLSKLLFYGSGKPFVEKVYTPGYEQRLVSTDFYIKAYDKGTHQNAPDQRLRFEKGVTVMKNLNGKKLVVVTLADLNNPARLEQLGTLLLDSFDRCFWSEDFSRVSLTDAQQQTVTNAHNVAYVASLTPTQRTRLKDAYDQIANRLNYRLSTDLRAQIRTKWNALLELDCKVLQRGGVKGFTRLENVVKPYMTASVNEPCETLINTEGTAKEGGYFCIVTGLNIDDQQGAKRYVSTSTVRRLYNQDRATFDMLAGRYLSAKQAGAVLDKQCESIAHNIRNAHTNPRNNPVSPFKKYFSVKVGQTLPLFDPSECVQPTARQRAALDIRRGTRWEIPL